MHEMALFAENITGDQLLKKKWIVFFFLVTNLVPLLWQTTCSYKQAEVTLHFSFVLFSKEIYLQILQKMQIKRCLMFVSRILMTEHNKSFEFCSLSSERVAVYILQ